MAPWLPPAPSTPPLIAEPVDAHCAAVDGGTQARSTSAASCKPSGVVDAGAGANNGSCPYGPTRTGHQSYDDDCKYAVHWSSGPLCESATGAPVAITAVVTHADDGTPLTGAATRAEVFATNGVGTGDDAGCDNQSLHPAPAGGTFALVEGPAGTYAGTIYFDQPGAWTVRFHFFESCSDVLPDSPHGHAAYRVSLP